MSVHKKNVPAFHTHSLCSLAHTNKQWHVHTISIRLYHKGSLQSWIAPLQPVAVLIGGPLKLLCSCEWVICALYKCKSTTLTVYKQGSPLWIWPPKLRFSFIFDWCWALHTNNRWRKHKTFLYKQVLRIDSMCTPTFNMISIDGYFVIIRSSTTPTYILKDLQYQFCWRVSQVKSGLSLCPWIMRPPCVHCSVSPKELGHSGNLHIACI